MSKRTTKNDLRVARERFENEVAGYVIAHPELPLPQVGEMFGIDRRELYAIRKRRGLPRRTNERKVPRISAQKRETT